MTPTDLKIAMFPQSIKWGDKASNIDMLIDAASHLHPETDLLILPETFSTGFVTGRDKEEIRALAERNTGKTIDTVKAVARSQGVAIAGSFIADSGGLLFNRAFFIEPNGEETFADKRHLFTMAGEHKIFSRGNDRLSVRYRGWNIAMIVCYDVRFPIWCRNRQNEYDLLIGVANWPKVRANAWNLLLQARAVENEAYVAGVNCSGTDDHGFEYGGDTHAFDFKGKDLAVRDDASGLLYARLDYGKLQAFREKFPAWRDAD